MQKTITLFEHQTCPYKYLKEEYGFQRGLYRNYIAHEENLGVLKGKWLISQHFRVNPFQKHRFYVQYDDFSHDTPLNQVLKLAARQMRNQSMDSNNRQQLAMLSDWMDEVNILPTLNNAVLGQVIFTRLNERFRPLFNLARLFLKHQAMETKVGATKTFAYTFDMNKLFEKFISRFLQKHKGRILRGTGYENCGILEKAHGNHKWLAKDDIGKNIFMLEPDIIFKKEDGSVPLIIDTKYKTLNGEKRKKEIKEGDMYQAAAYAQVYKCKRVILIYPQVDNKIQEIFKLSGIDASVEVKTVNLSTDLPKEVLKVIEELNIIVAEK